MTWTPSWPGLIAIWGRRNDLLIVRQDPTLDIDIFLSKDDSVYVIKEGQMVIGNSGPTAARREWYG